MFSLLLTSLLAAQVQATELVSISPSNQQIGCSTYDASSISANGRFIAFESSDRIYVRDRLRGTSVLASVAVNGSPSTGFAPSISGRGRLVVFCSEASDLVLGDTNNKSDVFVRDLLAGTTTRVSVSNSGTEGNSDSGMRPYEGFSTQAYLGQAISADGRFVAFMSSASNLVANDTNGYVDVFVRDLQLGITVRASESLGGQQANMPCSHVSISANGRRVAFQSFASNLAPGFGKEDVFVKDLPSGQVFRVSTGNPWGTYVLPSQIWPSISANGEKVAFSSSAKNLVNNDPNNIPDVFVHDLATGTLVCASISSVTGLPAGGVTPSLDATGQRVAYRGYLMPNQDPTLIFIRDLTNATATIASVGVASSSANSKSWLPAISWDGMSVVFSSRASNLVSSDLNGQSPDAFVSDF